MQKLQEDMYGEHLKLHPDGGEETVRAEDTDEDRSRPEDKYRERGECRKW